MTFEPGAHTAWHTHPLGQTLYITEGCALIQSDGEEIVAAGPGDIVQIPAKVRHWHGASEAGAMTHLALSESLDGSVVTWMEKLDSETYSQAAGRTCGN